MKYVAYLGKTVVTSDGVADALVAYARALVMERTADVIDIPVVLDGKIASASLLIGIGGALMVTEATGDAIADIRLDESEPIATMQARATDLGPHRARPSESVFDDAFALSYDFL